MWSQETKKTEYTEESSQTDNFVNADKPLRIVTCFRCLKDRVFSKGGLKETSTSELTRCDRKVIQNPV